VHRFTLILIFVLSLVRLANAQGLEDIAGPFGLPISAATVERYSGQLGLDIDQKQLARSLHQGYRASLRQALKTGNEEIKALQSSEDRDARANKGMEVLDKFADKHQAIEQDFLGDLRAILKPEQESTFESVLRARRREVQMRFAFVAGEGVDLVAVLNNKLKVKHEAGSELATTIADYEAAIDPVMIEKQKVMRSSLRRAFKLQKNGMPDFQLIESIIKDLYSVGTRIRDINRRFVRLIEPQMSEAARAELTAEVRLLSFPRVYSRTLAHKVLDAAKQLPELTPEKTEELKTIAASYGKDLEAANRRYAEAIETTQERFPRDFLLVMQMRNETAGDDPLIKARVEREELQQSVFKRVKALVGAEAFANLPQTDSDRNRFPDFLPDLRSKKEWDDFEDEEKER
jgi:hypothetical protein